MKIVVTVVGKDRVGIIATVSTLLAENKVNILSINQNIMDGFFNMVMLAETTDDAVKLGELAPQLKKKGEEPKYFDVEQIQTNDNQTKSGIIDLWVDCLMEGKESPISGESVLSAMRAVFASMESSETGKAVDIPANR